LGGRGRAEGQTGQRHQDEAVHTVSMWTSLL
jgi:hypothetical protein